MLNHAFDSKKRISIELRVEQSAKLFEPAIEFKESYLHRALGKTEYTHLICTKLAYPTFESKKHIFIELCAKQTCGRNKFDSKKPIFIEVCGKRVIKTFYITHLIQRNLTSSSFWQNRAQHILKHKFKSKKHTSVKLFAKQSTKTSASKNPKTLSPKRGGG